MGEPLVDFVHETLDSMGAKRAELAPGCGVWRADLPESASRFLGRPQSDLLYTFDLTRWEEGARLECLNRHSPLVARLRAYALARGGVSMGHVSDPRPNPRYQAYLAARFHAVFSSGFNRSKAKWLGVNLDTGAPVHFKGDPLSDSELLEGAPAGASMPDSAALESGLNALADTWNRHMARDTRELQATASRRYTTEAAEILSAKSGSERDRLLDRLRDRLRVTTECRLDMALLLWLPAR
jgi:hypothetical protein